jgi:hypothetical protein
MLGTIVHRRLDMRVTFIHTGKIDIDSWKSLLLWHHLCCNTSTTYLPTYRRQQPATCYDQNQHPS